MGHRAWEVRLLRVIRALDWMGWDFDYIWPRRVPDRAKVPPRSTV